MAMLTIHTLGQFQARSGADVVRGFRSSRAEALLCYLAVEADRAHRREHLMTLLWPEEPEAVARANLRISLFNLRQAIGDASAVPPYILVSSTTLQWNSASEYMLDVAAFDAACAATRAHDHAALQTCRPCLEQLAQALTFYRGDFLAGFTLPHCQEWEEWVTVRREELRQQALAALAALVDHHERRGARDLALVYARRLLELDPWREETHRRVMLLLAQQGETQAALAQLELLRRILEEEFSLAPTSETLALAHAIRAGNLPDEPEQKAQLLPGPPTALLGREAELASIKTLLTGTATRLLTLVGPPGIGKTRLAQEAAVQLAPDFIDGVVFVALAPLTDPQLLLATIADALGLNVSDAAQLERRVLAYLQHKQLLLVLDNFEHLLDSTPQVAALLQASRELRVLVTSRAALRVRAEREFPVPPLALPALDPLAEASADPAALADYAALRLFVERAQAIKPTFALTPDNAAAVAAICTKLDGLPLAIELAAGRLRLFTPQELLARLKRRLQVLVGDRRDGDPRQQTLRAAIAWSYDLLTPAEQILFRRLAVFSGGCSVAAILGVYQEIAAQEEGESALASAAADALEIEVLATVAALVSQNLLQTEPGHGGETRFTMLETIHEYAIEQLAASDEALLVYRAHARYFLKLAEDAAPWLSGSEQAVWMDRLEEEHNNLRAALGWCLEQQQVALAARLAIALEDLWQMHNHAREAHQWLTRCLAAQASSPALSDYALGRLHRALARFGGVSGDPADATYHARRSVALFAAAVEQAEAQDGAGATTSARLDGTVPDRSSNLWLLKSSEAWALHGLGTALRDQGFSAAGRDCFERALVIQRDIGDRDHMTETLHALGWQSYMAGNYERAAELYAESLALARQTGRRWAIFWNLLQMSLLERDQLRFSQAERLLQECSLMVTAMGNHGARAMMLGGMGELERARGNHAAAGHFFEQALSICQAYGYLEPAVSLRIDLGWTCVALGNLTAGQDFFNTALQIALSYDFRPQIVYSLLGLAHIFACDPDAATRSQGARLLAAVRANAAALGDLFGGRVYQERLAELNQLLGSYLPAANFEQALREGEVLSLQATADLALAQPTVP